ncbi:MAG: hypothetical protein JNK15_22310 [Planctomycetes bacterium]|nr:hypothetical protein [Planctomycetota bacterium]
MTSTRANSPDPVPATAPSAGRDLGSALLRAFVRAAVVVVASGAVVGVGLFPAAVLPLEAVPFYGAGLAAALLAGMVALLLHGRIYDRRANAIYAGDGRLLAQRLQSLLAAALGAKLAILVLSFFVLRACGVKFADTATFAVTFAGGALLCQLATAMSLARSMQPRSSSSGLAGTGAPGGNVP